MRVAVIGGGIFGCAIAVDLARAGAVVELFEARSDILEGTTARNMARLHSGYHYPRSKETATATRDAAILFKQRFPEAVQGTADHWYLIAPGSKVNPVEYVAFLDQVELPYRIAGETAPFQVHTADLIVSASEAFIDIAILRRLLRRDLAVSNVSVHVGHQVAGNEVPGFDVTIWATYGVPWLTPLKYEVCEVALMELGRYNKNSFVVIDGEFISLDPIGRLYSLYDVVHSVHHVSVGTEPQIPEDYTYLINRYGPVKSPLSRFHDMVTSASRFLWGLQPTGQHTSIYHGSMWSLRAVLPDVEDTDERPTLIRRDGSSIRVLSGKLCTAATIGATILNELGL